MQLGAGATSDASIPAILVVGMVHVRMHAKICRLHAILGRSVGPWRCSMRAYAFPIAALHSGMRVVCVRVRENITSPPPTHAVTVDIREVSHFASRTFIATALSLREPDALAPK